FGSIRNARGPGSSLIPPSCLPRVLPLSFAFAARLFGQRPCSVTVPGAIRASERIGSRQALSTESRRSALVQSVIKKYARPAGTEMLKRTYYWVRRKIGGDPAVPDNEITIRLQAHRQNIARYRSLLRTQLTEIERAFIDRRIAEEETAMRRLSALARRQRIAEAGGGPVPFDSSANAH